jgi:hypothetical protein
MLCNFFSVVGDFISAVGNFTHVEGNFTMMIDNSTTVVDNLIEGSMKLQRGDRLLLKCVLSFSAIRYN